MVVRGIISLAKKVGDDEMITKGNALLTKAVAVYVVAVVAGLIGTLLKKSPTAMTIAGILLLISAVLAIIVYITYLKYLGKAVRMLEK
jgi:phosphatidylglycerophosphate synthase